MSEEDRVDSDRGDRGERPVVLTVLAAAAFVFLAFATPVEFLGGIVQHGIEGEEYSTNWLRVFRVLAWPAFAALTVFLWMGFRWAWVGTQMFLGLVLLVAIFNFGGPWPMLVIVLAAGLVVYLNTPRVRSFCSLGVKG